MAGTRGRAVERADQLPRCTAPRLRATHQKRGSPYVPIGAPDSLPLTMSGAGPMVDYTMKLVSRILGQRRFTKF